MLLSMLHVGGDMVGVLGDAVVVIWQPVFIMAQCSGVEFAAQSIHNHSVVQCYTKLNSDLV